MNKKQKELIKTYYRKRNIAVKGYDDYTYKDYELNNFAFKNDLIPKNLLAYTTLKNIYEKRHFLKYLTFEDIVSFLKSSEGKKILEHIPHHIYYDSDKIHEFLFSLIYYDIRLLNVIKNLPYEIRFYLEESEIVNLIDKYPEYIDEIFTVLKNDNYDEDFIESVIKDLIFRKDFIFYFNKLKKYFKYLSNLTIIYILVNNPDYIAYFEDRINSFSEKEFKELYNSIDDDYKDFIKEIYYENKVRK